MVNPICKQISHKKQTHRAGKKARARRSKRRALEVKSHTEFTEKALSNQGISISASRPETLTSSPQENLNSESGSDTKITNTFAVNLLVEDDPNNLNTYLPEHKVYQELYQNATNLEGKDNEPSLSEDFIFQLNSLLPDELLNI
ncbi:unnamed protein product [Lasius platythorax]|uniref:Uncharacterized protein n=1 Tax=Lasius platythorax TaxID=488582 RepID=A0AAV2N3H7_9HYME